VANRNFGPNWRARGGCGRSAKWCAHGIVVDSRGRVIVTDPPFPPCISSILRSTSISGSNAGTRAGPDDAPQCVAVDGKDNIYVTDSVAGKVFVFDPQGKTRKCSAA
jgi:DNA-binding beta-propeller fold protein YncE